MMFFKHNMFRFDMLYEPFCSVPIPELTSYGGTMAASLRHQWRETICGGSAWMHPSNHVNNEADLAFTAAVAQAVADLLPTFSARITDEIRQNKNNGNNGNRRNSRRGNPGGLGNDEDAQPTDIHVWLERFRKEKPQTFSSASTPVEAENWISHIEKIFEVLGCDDQFKARLATYKLEVFSILEERKVANAARNIEIFRDRPKNKGDNKRDKDGHRIRPSETPTQGSNQKADDRRDSDRYGNRGRHGNKDRYGTDRWRGDRHGNDIHVNGSDRHGNSSQQAATGACFECGEVEHLDKDYKKGSTSSRGKRFGPAFNAAVAQAVADLLPTLTARITDEIR
nr:hypothetical protein [Tanacetum cinerariifolium]